MKHTMNVRMKPLLLAGLFSSVALGLAACGASSIAGRSSSAGGSRIMGRTASAGLSATVEHIKALVAAEEKPPHPIILPQLTKRPPSSVSVGLVTCPLPECQAVIESAQQAVKVLGWKLTVYQGGLEPATVVSATEQAVQAKPAALIDITAFPPDIITKPLALATSMHVPIVDIASTSPPSGPVIADSGANEKSIEVESTAMADWVIADSNGNAKVLTYADNGVQSQTLPAQVVGQVFAKDCPGCKLTVEQYNIADTGTSFPGEVVSYLQQHPGYQYIVMPDGSDAAGLGAAIKAAGIPLPKIVSRIGTPVNFTDITKGLEAVTVTEELDAMAWRAMDVIARRLVGDPISSCCVEPVTQYQILSRSNITNPSQPWSIPDLKQTFMKVWRITG